MIALRKALRKRTAEVQARMHSDNTRRTYGSGVLQFALFLSAVYSQLVARHDVASLASDQLLAEFVVFQSSTCGPGTLKVYLYAIRAYVMAVGLEFRPWPSRYPVYSAMMGLKRICGDAVTRKLAVTPKMLLQFVAVMNMHLFNDVMMWAAMLVAFFGLFRKDNITVGKAGAFNPRANLTVGDIQCRADGSIWVRVAHSKTIQFQERCHLVPLVAMPGHPLCPVAAVKKVLALHVALGSGPQTALFLWKTPGARAVRPMTHGVFVTGFKQLVKLLGLDWTKFSGHSFRRGGATFCFNLGVDPNLIKMLGDWKSDAYLLYEETTETRRTALPEAMARAISAGILDHGPSVAESV